MNREVAFDIVFISAIVVVALIWGHFAHTPGFP